MLILAFDTTMAACSAAVYDSATFVVRASTHEAMDKGHAEAIAPMVQAVLREAGVEPSALGRIAVTAGPGTFTGQRIGLALAHGMGVALGCEVVGVDTLTATAAPQLKEHSDFWVVHQAGGTGKFYAARFVNHALQGDLRFVGLDAILESGSKHVIGTGSNAVVTASAGAFKRLEGEDLPSARNFIRYVAALPAGDHYPQPVYLREPDAKPSVAMQSVVIREAVAADMDVLAKLHQMSFTSGWNEESLRSALSLPGSGAMVMEMAGSVRAFILFQIAADEAEILTLCCEPRWRRRGLGEKLLSATRNLLRTRNISKLHLEVAADNGAAEALYLKSEFVVTGRRKGYYARKDGIAVDALLMSAKP